jgi:hypothetical protein
VCSSDLLIMLVGIGGLMALFVVAAAKNAGQGDQATRTTEYAQDKIEQLLALPFNDSTTLVVGSTTTPNGGTSVGLAGPGSVDPLNPSAGYVDYVDASGAIWPPTSGTTAPAGTVYMRQWSVALDSTQLNGISRNVKTITVKVSATFSADVGANLASLKPSTTLIAVKASY